MTLTPGTKVGPYEVVGLIGTGGMGQVFRARDARLKRDVALKVLAAAVATDADRRSRFEREAQVLGSLSHANIAQIYGVEDAAGSLVLVMELVEGPTLAEHLRANGVSLEEALSIGRQLCEGLEAAHERGIIHRDLKPANIKIREDGTVKILDFGLAKAMSSAQTRDDVSADSPTVLSPATDIGVILGTAAYMSPEQARGRAVDKRADIWAFGCVLYEMLAGRPVFTGETTTDILAAVIRSDPDWSKLPERVPARIVELLRRCLQAQPKDRLRDIADARYEIERALRTAADRSAETGRSSATDAAEPSRPSTSFGGRILWLIGGAALAAALILIPRALRPNPALVESTVRSIIELPPDTTLAPSRGSAVALSPDARRLVFVGRSKGKVQLYLRALDRFEAQPIAGTDGAANPFFSPDGQWVGFVAEGKLKKVSIEGGAPVALTDARNARGEAWGDANVILITPLNNVGISRLSALGGDKPEPVTTLAGELSHRWPRFLPGSSTVLYSIWNDTGWEPARIVAKRLPDGESKVIVPAGGGYPRYVRDGSRRGYLVYARADGILAAPFDEDRLETTGPIVPVVDGVLTNLSGGAHFDLSPSGTLAYVPGTTGEGDRDLMWVTFDGHATPVLRIHNMSRFWTLSPDGTRVARNNTAGPNRDMWIENLTNGTSVRLTQSNDNYDPNWSPDGKWLVFARGIPFSNIFRRPADGTGVEERLTDSNTNQQPSSISQDGTSVLYNDIDPASGSDIWVLTFPNPAVPIQKTAKPSNAAVRPFIKTNFSEGNGTFSPNGRFVLYQSNESGRFEVYVRPYPEGVRKFPVSIEGGIWSVWSPTGREIFYRGTNNMMMSVAVETASEFRSSKPRPLFDAASYEIIFAVAADGRRLLMMPAIATETSATQIHLVMNFLDELRQRVK
ncbi:MAG TPA: protein kinase [Vicinamibacterales bacterium]|nr:protein kinase [Vicinamibacterales bacterium]